MLDFRYKNNFYKKKGESKKVQVFIVYVTLNKSSIYYRKYEDKKFKHRRSGAFMYKSLVLFKGRYNLTYFVNEEDQVYKYYKQSRQSSWGLYSLYSGSFLFHDYSKNLNGFYLIEQKFLESYIFSILKLFLFIKKVLLNYNYFLNKFINIDTWVFILIYKNPCINIYKFIKKIIII